MRFDCGETEQEENDRLATWHRFFAIWPRRVGSHDCRCFEWIERKGTKSRNYDEMSGPYDYWTWEYRPMTPGTVLMTLPASYFAHLTEINGIAKRIVASDAKGDVIKVDEAIEELTVAFYTKDKM